MIEPNAEGDGTVGTNGMITTYGYDDLDRLIQVNQGAQTRRFRYGRTDQQNFCMLPYAFGKQRSEFYNRGNNSAGSVSN